MVRTLEPSSAGREQVLRHIDYEGGPRMALGTGTSWEDDLEGFHARL